MLCLTDRRSICAPLASRRAPTLTYWPRRAQASSAYTLMSRCVRPQSLRTASGTIAKVGVVERPLFSQVGVVERPRKHSIHGNFRESADTLPLPEMGEERSEEHTSELQ